MTATRAPGLSSSGAGAAARRPRAQQPKEQRTMYANLRVTIDGEPEPIEACF